MVKCIETHVALVAEDEPDAPDVADGTEEVVNVTPYNQYSVSYILQEWRKAIVDVPQPDKVALRLSRLQPNHFQYRSKQCSSRYCQQKQVYCTGMYHHSRHS